MTAASENFSTPRDQSDRSAESLSLPPITTKRGRASMQARPPPIHRASSPAADASGSLRRMSLNNPFRASTSELGGRLAPDQDFHAWVTQKGVGFPYTSTQRTGSQLSFAESIAEEEGAAPDAAARYRYVTFFCRNGDATLAYEIFQAPPTGELHRKSNSPSGWG